MTERELEDRLSAPAAADIEAARAIEGDVLILGAGGKMGPSLARLVSGSFAAAGKNNRVIAVARFSNPLLQNELHSAGVETIACDLLDSGVLAELPSLENVIFMAARKFGTTGAEHLTWAMNTYLPGLVAERFRNSRIVAFSTGNVYGLTPAVHGGSAEASCPQPVGEYAQSALGRERMFAYGSDRWGTPVTLLRLNYAVELRYGVLVDIALAVFERRSVDLGMGLVNVLWQRDANSIAFRSLLHCQSPPLTLNLTGPETLSVRYIASEFGERFQRAPVFAGQEQPSALLNNAGLAHRLFGYPTVTPLELMDWIADWISQGGSMLGKPTHFEVRHGAF